MDMREDPFFCASYLFLTDGFCEGNVVQGEKVITSNGKFLFQGYGGCNRLRVL